MSARLTSLKTNEVGVLRDPLLPGAREPVLAAIRSEADDHLPIRPGGADRCEDIGGRLELDRPARAVLRALLLGGRGGPVVGDRSRHHDDVGIGARERLALDVRRGRSLDDGHAGGRRDREIRSEEGHVGSAASGLLGERHSHATGRAVPDEADGVERLARPSRGHEHPLPAQAGRPAECRLDTSVDLLRLRHAPDALFTLGELALRWADDLHAAGTEPGDVLLRRRVLPHARVHRGRHEDRALVREHGLRQHVVGEPVRQPREGVRRERCDHDGVPVAEVRIGLVARCLTRERPEGLGGDEALGAGREHRVHVVSGANEQPDEGAGLVGRYPPGHSEQDARHTPRLSSAG